MYTDGFNNVQTLTYRKQSGTLSFQHSGLTNALIKHYLVNPCGFCADRDKVKDRNIQKKVRAKPSVCPCVCIGAHNLCSHSQVILRKIAGRPRVRGHASEGIVLLKGYLGLSLVL